MIDVLTAEDVRRRDAEAASRDVPVEALMENAGRAVARSARALLGGTYGRRVVVVAGKGNNGGDGLVAARYLRAWGAHATVVLTEDRSGLAPLALANLARFEGPVRSLDALNRELARADLVVDAVLGVGLRRAPEGAAAEAIGAMAAADAPVLAVDVPSGVDADTGAVPGVAVRAVRTVTFDGLKPGLLFAPGAASAGAVEVAPIGMPRGAAPGAARALEAADVARALPQRTRHGHKRSSGVVLVVAGSRAMPGAAALVAGAAVHAGAGLTTLCAPAEVCAVVAARVPEVTTIPLPESGEGTLEPKALELLAPRLDGFDAVAVGPGLSTHPAALETVRGLVGAARIPLVLDADGLTAFAGEPQLLASHDGPLVLTPHAGELARVLGRPAAELEADRLGAAREAVVRTGGVTVFKGPGTVVAGPSGVFVNTTGSAALSQGGTGDVLAGMLASILAQGASRARSLEELVAAGVWLHGRAADRLAARLAPHPANASALIDELGPAMHEVLYG